MNEKIFLLTGASGGLGISIASTLLSQGARLVLQGSRSLDNIQNLLTSFPAPQTHVCPCDLSQPGAAQELWQAAAQWAGHLDGVINNAGFMVEAGIHAEYPLWQKAWQETLQVNLISAADLSYLAIRHALAHQRPPELTPSLLFYRTSSLRASSTITRRLALLPAEGKLQ